MAGFVSQTGVAPLDSKVGWINDCKLSQRAKVDPIVFPGLRGASHSHDFYGAKNVSPRSTPKRLRRGGTTCSLATDTAAYWIPTLYSEGRAIPPVDNEVDFYYRRRTQPDSAIRPFPPGLMVIAGNSKATGPQPTRVLDWDCENGGSDADLDHPVDCGTGWVSVDIKFPDCWDGRRLDSRNHRSHMAYSVDPDGDDVHACPNSHPVPVPELKFSVEWQVHDGTRIRLASGPYYTLHADFVNSWKLGALEDLVRRCLNAGVDCGRL